jgi:ubiquinone/menaquinone biosynthesis C-methylase UbiE
LSEQRYVPAAGREIFTGLYDPVVGLTMRERQWRPALVAEVVAALPQGGTVADVGAGTGSFAIALAAARPDASVVGIDGDVGVLERARRKPGGEAVKWREGLAGELPLEAGEVEAVVMSLLLHHLAPPAKRAALTDARRVLSTHGRLHIADWGRPRGILPRAGFLALRVLDGFEGTREHAAGLLPSMIAQTGFEEPLLRRRLPTVWGTFELLVAGRSAAGIKSAAESR